MTPEKRAELTAQLAQHGLSVLLTRDYDAILLHLARLAQFERLVMANGHLFNPADIEAIRRSCDSGYPSAAGIRLLDILDIPVILAAMNRELRRRMDEQTRIDPDRLSAATAAFIGILCAEVKP